ncbi:ERBB receptor feedback inhibitor 1a [Denticeps clupeoides]|uniref:ERBB receptor feedback inhibitor 1 n=1 Tax=Denticeps clupeoides TaxID=299321 RepID=A0AAY4CW14_9TELE|nr:ERBB receptor feedback inhibitor 1 [Denticeps clupeoides]
MRPDCSWSMSTAGLTAQEICLPSQNLFLRGSHCHSMAGTKPSCYHPHDLDNLYLSLDSSVGYNLPSQQQVLSLPAIERSRPQPQSQTISQRLPPKNNRPSQLSLFSSEPFTSSTEDDQVVPSFQRLSVYDRSSPPQTPSRGAKPLPPLPSRVDLSHDQAMDNEVEFFTGQDDNRCLMPEPCPKPSPFRYGIPSRRSFRGFGEINYAYYEGPSVQPRHQQAPPQLQKWPELEIPKQPQQEGRQQAEPIFCYKSGDRVQRKLRRSHSGPAGSFNKPTSLRLPCHHRNGQGMDKPEIPPRVPIPPRPAKTAADYRRWSAEVSSGAYSDDDRPPKVPPREPLSSSSSRTPSPNSLPTYLNGIMPPTQSFAPDPKYVSRGLQRQNSEGSPCILPVMENGKKASATHYFLLPQRPAYLDKLEKFFTDAAASRSSEATGTDWDSKRKPQVDLV